MSLPIKVNKRSDYFGPYVLVIIANEALVQLEVIDYDWNLKFRRFEENTSKRYRYSININGNKFVTLIVRINAVVTLYPRRTSAISVNYSEGISHEGNAQAFLTDYLQDKNNENNEK